jgi:hypothetical protein
MRPIVLFLALAGIGIIAWLIVARPNKNVPETKQQAIAVSKHSETFNSSVEAALKDYYTMTEAFVKWDSTAVNNYAAQLQNRLNTLKLDDLKKDSSGIYETAIGFTDNAKSDVQTITSEPGFRQKREALNSLSENLYYFLNTVKYDKEKLYFQQCPMAFDDTKPGTWLSQKEEIRNPYLGLKDPRYGKGMLNCGETKQVINHTGTE